VQSDQKRATYSDSTYFFLVNLLQRRHGLKAAKECWPSGYRLKLCGAASRYRQLAGRLNSNPTNILDFY
jgi:hypothetical protein